MINVKTADKEEYMFEAIYEQLALQQIISLEKKNQISIYSRFKNIIAAQTLENILMRQIKQELRKLSQSVLVVDINQARESGIFLEEDIELQYKEYIDKFFEKDYYTHFCNKYKLWCERCMQLVQSTYQYITEICEHFEKDLIGLKKKQMISVRDNDMINDIQFLGDLHNSGRCVAKCIFNDSVLIYKPTNGYIYEQYEKIIRIVSGNENFKTVKCFLTDTYFWCEYIRDETCETHKEIEKYYKNCGYLLACTYLLNSMDIHNENLIACGQYPVIIDAETIVSTDSLLVDRSNGRKILENSVFRSAMIPMYYDKREEGINDCSAIGDEIVIEINDKVLMNEFTSKVLEQRRKKQQNDINTHLPKWKGKVYPVWNYVKELLDGFHEGYQNIIDHQDDIIKVFSEYGTAEIRVVIRSTAVYTELLKRINMPDFLQNKEIVINFLERLLRNNSLNELSLQCEIDQLIKGNIPYFVMKLEEDVIRVKHKDIVLHNILECPVHYFLRKIKGFSIEDEARQIRFIKIAFNDENCNFASIKANNLSDITCEINAYKEKSVFTIDNETCRFSLQKNWKGQYLYDEINDGIYQGYLGLALYDTEIKRDTKVKYYKIFQKISEGKKWGIIDGYAAKILYLYQTPQFSFDEKEAELKSICNKMQKMIPIKANVNNIDLIEGMSGAIVALSHFIDNVSLEMKDTIIQIICHLAESIINVWKEKREAVIKVTGFAHGIAGIKTALYVAYCISKKTDYYTIFQELEDIDSLERYKTINWCNGIVGYYAAYYLLYKFSNDKKLYQEKLLQGVKIILNNVFCTDDFCLCHGFLGAVDFLLTMEEAGFLDEEQKKQFLEIQNLIVFKLKEKSVCISDVSLFTGITGILYIEKRKREKVPSILTYLY